jgi:hypothetical protein
MSLHSYQWPTSPHNPVKPAVRNCAFQLAWHKFQDHHHISSADRRSHYEHVLRDIVRELADSEDLDAIMIANKAYYRLIKLARS